MSALLARLLDDAALFPPRRAPMDEALSAYRTASGSASGPADREPLGAKYRVGGAVAGGVPSAGELAAFISACAERDLPFTCAAGSLHAVRGASHHGLMNVLLATAHAAAGESERGIRRTLQRTDAALLADDLLTLPEHEARAARCLLPGFSTSDVRGGRADLTANGLIRMPDIGKIGLHDDRFLG